MRISLDSNIPLPSSWLPSAGVTLETFHGRELTNRMLQQTDVLLVRSVTAVTHELLQGTGVRFVGTATAGIDHLDTQALDELGIPWAAAPGCNADAVVDYVLASLARLGVDPRTRRAGIIGCGQVGGRLYRRLQQLGVSCLCHDPFLDASQQASLVGLEQLLDESDLVSLHTPLTRGGPWPTWHMLGQSQLARLQSGSLLINAGRGGVIDEQALLQRMRSRGDLRLVIDVWQGEPQINTELQGYAALATPHIAGYSSRGKLRGSWMLLRGLVKRFGLNWPVPEQLPLVFEGLELAPGLDWRSAILELYDPAEDDMRLRDAYAVNGSVGFDRLRQAYPQRPELGECRSTDAGLKAWGFGG